LISIHLIPRRPDDHVVLGGYPGELRALPGIHVEEFDPWLEEMTNQVVIQDGPLHGSYPCTLWGEVVHLEGARAIGVFASDYYADGPALTVHRFGNGQAYYLATQGRDELLAKLARVLCQEARVTSLMEVAEGVEVMRRLRNHGRCIYFILNHSDVPETVVLPGRPFTSLLSGAEVTGHIKVAARDVLVLLEK
jgi:beta-galactosidase